MKGKELTPNNRNSSAKEMCSSKSLLLCSAFWTELDAMLLGRPRRLPGLGFNLILITRCIHVRRCS